MKTRKTLKTVTVGDPHGRNFWESLNPDDYDLMIFLGDYVDSYDLSNLEIKFNLINIIELKRKYPDKVILLLGNHDLPYYNYVMGNPNIGFRVDAWVDLYHLFNQNKNMFKCAFQYENYIWTHGGVHEGWYNKYVPEMVKNYDIEGNVAEILNILFKSNYKSLYTRTAIRGGFSEFGGPFWCHWTKLLQAPLKGYHQIVGHTFRENIDTVNVDSNTSATIVDPGDGGANKFYYLDI